MNNKEKMGRIDNLTKTAMLLNKTLDIIRDEVYDLDEEMGGKLDERLGNL